MRRFVWALVGFLLTVPSTRAAGEVPGDSPLRLSSADGRHTLGVGTLLQTRLAFESVKEPDRRRSHFTLELPRARLSLGGKLGTGLVRYHLEAGFDNLQPLVADAYVDVRLVRGLLRMRVGHMRRPFSRQFLTRPSRLALADRALTDHVFASGRDVGLLFHDGEAPGRSFEWTVGFFNGHSVDPVVAGKALRREAPSAATVPSEVMRFRPALALRVGFRQGRVRGYDESDPEKGNFRWALAAALFLAWDVDGTGTSSVQGQVDFMVKYRGFSATAAAYLASGQEGGSFHDRRFAAFGYHVQAAMRVGTVFEPALRFTHLIFPEPDTDVKEGQVALSFLFSKLRLKWTTEAGLLIRELPGGYRSDIRVLTQLQFAI